MSATQLGQGLGVMSRDGDSQFWTLGPLWILGVLICLFGTSMTALGLVLLKYSHSQNAKSTEAVVYYRQSWWRFGFLVFVVGQLFNLAAMAMAPQPMLSCIGACALIFNVIFAWAVLGEPISIPELVPMGGMVVGALIVICATPVNNILEGGTAGFKEITGPLFQPPFLLLFTGIALFLLLFRSIVACHVTAAMYYVLFQLFWALSSAISNGYAVTLFKCFALLLAASDRTHPWAHWQCYAILLVASSLCLIQTHTLNMALRSGRAMIVLPTVFAFGLKAQIIICEITYHEMRDIDRFNTVMFVLGLILIVASVVVLVRMKIATDAVYEFEAADAADPGEDNTAPAEFVPLLKAGSKGLPARSWSFESLTGAVSENVAYSSTSSLDHEAFRESFDGRCRSYTVSVTGPLGLA